MVIHGNGNMNTVYTLFKKKKEKKNRHTGAVHMMFHAVRSFLSTCRANFL